MAFRFINNSFQNIGAKGFVVVLVASAVMHFTNILPITITLPFLLPCVLLWLIGYSMINSNNNEDEE